jgi:RNA polymerase sigma factor (TIGR02999 family)
MSEEPGTRSGSKPGPESAARHRKDDPRQFRAVYDELLRIARRHLRRERPDHTLGTTALVHEAYVKLAGRPEVGSADPTWFLATASRAMRQILVDHGRRRASRKRGGHLTPVTLRTGDLHGEEETVDLLALDQALSLLATRDERLERLVECRFFGGLTLTETAAVLEVSERTVERDWVRARAYLAQLLGPAAGRS